MTPPHLGQVVRFLDRQVHSPTRTYDLLVLVGPAVIGTFFVLGRGPLTDGLAVGYLAAFLGEILFGVS